MSTGTVAVQDRPYQAISRDKCFERWQGGDRSTLLVLPTGTGKTVVAGLVARAARDDHARRCLFLAHREELITQAADKLARVGLTTAIEMGPSRAREGYHGFLGKPDVVIATVQTLQGRRLESWDPDEFGMIICDEAHHARAKSYRTVFDHFRDHWLLGITATPDRGDNKNLGAVFDSLAYEYTLREAILDEYLVPIVAARLVTGVDLKDIRTTGGDYNDAELAARIAPFVEQLADATAREIGDRPAVVFCPDVRSSEAMADALTFKGIAARAVSGAMDKSQRRETLHDFHARKFQAIVCCDLLTEGWDEPQVSCVVICRPTRRRNRYAQMIGRGTRPDPDTGKRDCLVIDFAWETTSPHELCTTIDLFDDSHHDEAVRVLAAAIVAAARGQAVDPREALDQAERRIDARRRLRLPLTGLHPARYRKLVYDPVGVGALVGFKLKARWVDGAGPPATERQRRYLRDLGVDRLERLSRKGANELIAALQDRDIRGLSTPRQVAKLENFGVDPALARDMTRDQAKAAYFHLIKEHARVPQDEAAG
jgi:superfamily II DNA or RNA helicase